MNQELEKQRAAEAAAELVKDGMRLGLGTGTTVTHLLDALARRRLNVVCVATSPRTEVAARQLGINVVSFDQLDELDLAIDGADQIAPSGWIIKGAGGAQVREKLVAASAHRFIVIADSSKVVDHLTAPVPLELMTFGLASTLRRVQPTTVREVDLSPDGGVIADYLGDVGDPAELADRLSRTPGIVGHGLFHPDLIAECLVAEGEHVRTIVQGENQ